MQLQADLYEAFCATGRGVRDKDGRVIAWTVDDWLAQVIARLLTEVANDGEKLLHPRLMCE